MSENWPEANYFSNGTAFAKHARAALKLVDKTDNYDLYLRLSDNSYWRIGPRDTPDKRFIVRINDVATWKVHDSSRAEKELLWKSRGGESNETCRWKSCAKLALKESAFCLDHTYERGVRK